MKNSDVMTPRRKRSLLIMCGLLFLMAIIGYFAAAGSSAPTAVGLAGIHGAAESPKRA